MIVVLGLCVADTWEVKELVWCGIVSKAASSATYILSMNNLHDLKILFPLIFKLAVASQALRLRNTFVPR